MLVAKFNSGAITLNTLIDEAKDDDSMDFDELQLILEERDIIWKHALNVGKLKNLMNLVYEPTAEQGLGYSVKCVYQLGLKRIALKIKKKLKNKEQLNTLYIKMR